MTLDESPEPAAPHAGRRRLGRGARATITLCTAAVLLLGGYTAAIAVTPLPTPDVQLEVEKTEKFAVGSEAAQVIVDAEALPSAIGWEHSAEVWANTDQALPIASISKLVTVLVCLEQQPLEPGAEGPVHVWTAADAAQQNEYLARDGIAYPIPVGTEVTQRQMLTLALLPSANDFAYAYATSIFGDNATFVAAVNEWTARNELPSVVLLEPTGMDEGNVATPSDVLRIGRLALDNPTIAEFTKMQTADLPWGIGTVQNTNALLHRLPGMLGLKTGRSSSAGYNLVAAQTSDASGRELVKLAVTLGRDSPEARIDSTSGLLASLDALPQETMLVEAEYQVGSVTTVDGITVPLVATGAASTVLLPGETASRTVTLTEVGAGKAGQAAGSITVDTPASEEQVQIVTAQAIVEPDFGWRFTHPAKVFGWG